MNQLQHISAVTLYNGSYRESGVLRSLLFLRSHALIAIAILHLILINLLLLISY